MPLGTHADAIQQGFQCAYNKRDFASVEMFLKQGADIDVPFKTFNTPYGQKTGTALGRSLHIGNTEGCVWLIKLGAKLSNVPNGIRMAFRHAERTGDVRFLSVLLDANPTALYDELSIVKDYAMECWVDGVGMCLQWLGNTIPLQTKQDVLRWSLTSLPYGGPPEQRYKLFVEVVKADVLSDPCVELPEGAIFNEYLSRASK